MDFIHSVLCHDCYSGSPIDIVNFREGEGEEGRRDNSRIFFFQFFGISSPCAKFQSREALALFAEKRRKEAISPKRVVKANVLRQELQSTHVQRQRSEGFAASWG